MWNPHIISDGEFTQVPHLTKLLREVDYFNFVQILTFYNLTTIQWQILYFLLHYN